MIFNHFVFGDVVVILIVFRGDTEGKKAMSVLLHGDAAFAGQLKHLTCEMSS